MTDDEPWFDRPDDDEFPDEEDGDEPTETVPCPHCGAEVYEDADYCPYCQTYIIGRASIWSGRPTWWIILALLGILATVLALAGLFVR